MAYKTFANGYPLTASDLNNYLMNQTVMVFATEAARSAALTSPTEGMVTYREDGNSGAGILEVYNGTTWVDINDNTAAIPKSIIDAAGDLIVGTAADTAGRLAVGSAGSILKSNGTTPVYLAPGSSGYVLTSTGSDITWSATTSGGMTLLSTTTLSGASTTISSIAQGYKHLYIEVENVNVSVTGYLRVAPNGDTAISAQTYITSAASARAVNSDYMRINGEGTLTGGTAATGGTSINIYNYANSTTGKAWDAAFGGRSSTYGIVGGSITTNSAITSLVFSSSGASATFTAGTVRIYGVN